ncbi:DMT family transporter [Alicyclobacillus sp.]|uniref:DMT family transporter n=1 Tax=Alicyclobacillus sp. TaxID=61169 RepID=UPI0025C600AE|nr:DMT family transporter [Alicyclobacillus sp.]MCL6517743.1 DMT family transporter [Alicyclobacillus sp.]
MSSSTHFSPMTIRRPSRRLANLILLAVTLVWGATFTLTKDSIDHIPVFWFLAIRFFVASAALVCIVMITPAARRDLAKPSAWWRGAWLSLLLFGTYAFQTLGLSTTTPATAGFLTGVSVILVPLAAWPLLGVRPKVRTLCAVAIATVGLALLCGFQGDGWTTGAGLVLLCAVCVALQVVETERWGRGIHPLTLSSIEVWGLTLASTLAAGFQPWPGWGGLSTPGVWQAIVICAIPGTALAYWAQTALQQHTDAAQTALIFSMEPVFAALIGWLVRRDPLAMASVAGCVLILVGMLVADENIRLPGPARLPRRTNPRRTNPRRTNRRHTNPRSPKPRNPKPRRLNPRPADPSDPEGPPRHPDAP